MTQSRCTLDPGSPYAALNQTLEKGYWLVSLRSHPISPKAGKLRIHRAVCYDKCSKEGKLVCGLCGMAHLDWHVDRNDPRYVHVDHIDGNGSNNRSSNLRPTHKWCNDNRSIVEGYGIGWERWISVPIAQRPALRIAGGPNKGAPTPIALKLARVPETPFPVDWETQPPLPEAEAADETSDPTPEAAETPETEPLRAGFPAWSALRGPDGVTGPPATIIERFGCLADL